jgi:geranylgeranyl diphosphate synthase type I
MPQPLDLAQFKRRLDPILAAELRAAAQPYRRLTSDRFVHSVIGYASKMIEAGGKRLRPYVAYLGYVGAGGGKVAAALRATVGLELFHLFGLVHDDVMDSANLRHGLPTTHRHVAAEMRKLGRRGNLSHLGEAHAILLGDLLFAWAYERIGGKGAFTDRQAAAAIARFRAMVDEVLVGQLLDVDITSRRRITARVVEEKTALKTSRYTFVRPIQIGASWATGDGRWDSFAEKVGYQLGMAFQIQDDLLDLISLAGQTRKSALLDLANHQHTHFTQYIFDRGTPTQRQELSRLLGADPAKLNAARALRLFTDSGAIAYGQRRIAKHLEAAREHIEHSKLTAPYRRAWLTLVEQIANRSS